MLPSARELLDVLRRPLPPADLDSCYEFEPITLGGTRFMIDSDGADRVGAALALTLVPADAETAACLPLLVGMLDQDRTSALDLRRLVALLTDARTPPTRRARQQAEAVVFLAEADLACQAAGALVLGALGSPAVPILVRALNCARATRRAGAATALAIMGPAALPAAPALERAAALDPSETVRRRAWQALIATGGGRRPALP